MSYTRLRVINDTHGHLVGDRVLQTVVRATRQVLREGDVLLCYGGEEFAIVLPGAGRDDLTQMAERVRRAVAEAEINEAGQRITVTVSLGGSALPDNDATNPQELICPVDAALYTAKESGRDCWGHHLATPPAFSQVKGQRPSRGSSLTTGCP